VIRQLKTRLLKLFRALSEEIGLITGRLEALRVSLDEVRQSLSREQEKNRAGCRDAPT